MRIAVTGASGEFGQLAGRALLEIVPAEDVVLVSRSPDRLGHFAELGVELRSGDFDDPAGLSAALAGCEKVLLISTIRVGETRRSQHRAAIEAAEAAGVRRIAYTSAVGMHPHNPSFIIPDHLYTEDLLRRSPLEAVVLRMSAYADILATAIAPQAIATGQWVSSTGEGSVAFIAKEDCARSAAHAIAQDGHAGATYEITGPELLSHRQAAALAAELSGRPIAYVEPAVEADAKAQAESWIGPFTLADLLSSELAIRRGFSAICTHHVEMITGRPAKGLRDVFIEAGIGSRARGDSS